VTTTKIFPLGLAKGKAFCNRVSERKRISDNLKSGRHSLVISPRRYGKSSLVLYVLDELKIPHVQVDLFVAMDEAEIEQEILEGVKKLINKIIPVHEKILKLLKEQIKKLKLKLLVGSDGVSFELYTVEKKDPSKNIKSALILLEHVLAESKKEAVFFIDECQEIGVVSAGKGIEGAIRSVAQESTHLNFVFSGSNRHLLDQMFNDRSRPLYKLCDKIVIERIHEEDYWAFIQKISLQKWGEKLSETVLDKILELTECHPYYVNLICGRIWSDFPEKPPHRAELILKMWSEFAQEQKSDVSKDLGLLSELQKRLIIQIALGAEHNLTGKEMVGDLNATSAAVVKTLKILEKRDLIFYAKDGGARVLDPIIRMAIKLNFERRY
jgi:hypothetical protein